MEEVSFSEWLKRQRKACGLTQEQLADQIGCAAITLRKIEAEERRPSEQIVERLADIFKIPQDEHKSFLRFARGDWQAFASGYTDEAPWRVSGSDRSTNLPFPITSFIGRGKEQDDVIHLLGKNRLVTVVGIGGIGKTRLAIQVGHQLLNEYPDGVWFIPLDSLSDPLRLTHAVASVFEIREGTDRPILEAIKNVLHQKTVLLILDNCEHLLDACAQLVTTLLAHCPNLRILTTSRELLNIDGEATYYLPSLSMPEDVSYPETLAEFEAIQLFVERASLALSTFQITGENAGTILDICRRVDGIPLAIELTAARVNILKVEEISKQLRQSFAFLTSDHRTTISRHQTLQASLDWSWSLLTESEQIFLTQLSVFAGGWTLEAAEAVCDGNALNLTAALVQKSWIKVEQKQGRGTRYHFHEIVRQFVHDKLEETRGAERLLDKHLAYYVKLVEQAEPELYRSNQIYWLSKLDDELDNLRIALQWALATDVISGLRIAAIPWRFWLRRDYVQEADDWLGQLLERYPGPDSLRAHALAVHSNYMYFRGNMRRATPVAEQALQLARSLVDRPTEALSLFVLGKIIAAPGDHSGGAPFFEQSLAIYRTLGDKIGQATALMRLAIHHSDPAYSLSLLLESLKLHRDLDNLYDIAFCLIHLSRNAIYGGDFSSPPAWLEEARILVHELGSQPDEADAINILGVLSYWKGNYQQALARFEQAIALDEKIGNPYWANWPRINMAYTFLRDGNYQQAYKYFKICLQQFHRDNSAIGMVYTMEGVASLYVHRAQFERAVQLFACMDATRKMLGNPRPPIEQRDIDKDLTACLAQIDEAAFSDAYDKGAKMTLEEAVLNALEET